MDKNLTKKQTNHFISVIMPAFKTEKFIIPSLLNLKKILDQMRYPYEIICVVDGNVDDAYNLASKFAINYKDLINVTGYEINMGKGHAVRFGMAKAKGDMIALFDAGYDINPNSLAMLLEHFEWYDADIVVGSKRHQASKVIYPWQRRVISFGYQILIRILFGLKIRDTQAGIKIYKREVLEKTLPRLLVKSFAFDVEILSVANYLGFTRIFEAPIELKQKFGIGSTINKNFINTIWGMLVDTLAVYYRLKIIHYYDYKNRKNWITPDYLTLNRRK